MSRRMVTLPASAVRSAAKALDDWIATYASEFCEEAMVATAYRRIMQGGGTLAYICRVRMPLDEALKKARKKKAVGRRRAAADPK